MYNEDGDMWTFLYNQDSDESDDDGIVGMIECELHEEETIDEDYPYFGDQYAEDYDAVETNDSGLLGQSEQAAIEAQATRKGSALIVNLLTTYERGKPRAAIEDKYFRQLKGYLNSQGLDTKLWVDGITCGSFSALNRYDLLYVAGHGARYRYWVRPDKQGRYLDAWGIQVPYTGKVRTTSKLYEVSGFSVCQRRNDEYYAPWLKDRQIVTATKGYWVLPKFINVHYKKGAFRNTIILADSCSTMGSNNRLDTTMGSAFVRKGATAYAGFLNTVDGGYAKPYLREVIDGLLAGKTMGQSMGGADAKVGQSQKTWYEKTWKGKSYWNWGKDTYSEAYKLDCYPRYVGNRNGRLWYFLQNATYH